MSAHLFIVEDEPELASLMADYARAAGHTATLFNDGAAALAALRAAANGASSAGTYQGQTHGSVPQSDLVVPDLMRAGTYQGQTHGSVPQPDLLVLDPMRAGTYQGQTHGSVPQPDLLVLDLMLPGLDGLSLCRAVRAFSDLPIIMVTARVEEIDRLLGLEIGADDYLCKPFSPRELIARIQAILRRTRTGARASADAGAHTHTHTHTNAGADARASAQAHAHAHAQGHAPARAIAIDEAGRRIHVNGLLLELTPSEYAILAGMARRAGQVFSRAQLLDVARGDNLDVTDRAVDSHIKNLRRKLAAALPGLDPIASIYGLGYRLDL